MIASLAKRIERNFQNRSKKYININFTEKFRLHSNYLEFENSTFRSSKTGVELQLALQQYIWGGAPLPLRGLEYRSGVLNSGAALSNPLIS